MKMMMGEMEFRRAVYETRGSKGRKTFAYLLGEMLGKMGRWLFQRPVAKRNRTFRM
jgi:hypothetical protein